MKPFYNRCDLSKIWLIWMIDKNESIKTKLFKSNEIPASSRVWKLDMFAITDSLLGHIYWINYLWWPLKLLCGMGIEMCGTNFFWSRSRSRYFFFSAPVLVLLKFFFRSRSRFWSRWSLIFWSRTSIIQNFIWKILQYSFF